MPIRSIVVHIEDGAAGAQRIDASTALAHGLGAHLKGVYAIEPMLPKMAVSGSGIPAGTQPEAYEMQRHLRRHQHENLEGAKNCEQRFRRITQSADVDSEWQSEPGEADEVLARCALYADLIVIGQQHGDESESSTRDLADKLVLETGCPLLVIPTRCKSRILGDRISVAWNPDCQAQRALHAALPLLKRARRVEVITVNGQRNSLEQGPPMSGELRKYLARHGIPADHCRLSRNGQKIGDTLLSRAAAIDADLIVMGAYHHSRLREILLGGVTRHLLRHASLPMLISH